MHATTSRPEADPSSTAEVGPTPSSVSRADVALGAAIIAPLGIIGLLVLLGFGIDAAACITFVVVFAVTTTLDVTWTFRRRRSES